jgi:predicted porin
VGGSIGGTIAAAIPRAPESNPVRDVLQSPSRQSEFPQEIPTSGSDAQLTAEAIQPHHRRDVSDRTQWVDQIAVRDPGAYGRAQFINMGLAMKSLISLHVVVAAAAATLVPRFAAAQSPAPAPAPTATEPAAPAVEPAPPPAPAPPPPLEALPAPPRPPAPEPLPLLEVYGTLFPFLEFGHTASATPTGRLTPGVTGASQVATYSGINQPGRFRMDPGTTNLGFRGGLALVNNLSVVWQIESGVPVDGTAGANTFASRNSQIGLTGSWGTAFLGNWDTPYKWSTVTLVNPVRGGFIPDFNGILNTPGFGVASVTTQSTRIGGTADAAFDRRQGNAIQYWTPNVSGLSGRLLYSVDEGRNAATPAAPSITPIVFGASLAYEMGPIKVRDAFEAHFDYFGMSQLGGSAGDTVTNRSSTDYGNKITAQYSHATTSGFDTRVVGVFDYLSYKNHDSLVGANTGFARPGLYGLVDQTVMGQHHVWLAGGKAFQGSCEKVGGAACSTTGLAATDLAIGYLYRVNKSTDFFAVAYRISNEASASYSTSPALGAPPPTAPGVMVEAFGIGMLYSFSAKVAGPPAAH